MERGMDWEYEAVREEWAAMERRRQSVKPFLAGSALGAFGLVLLMIAAATEACIGDNGIVPTCAPVAPGPLDVAFGLAGLVALVTASLLFWSGSAIDTAGP